MARCTSRAGSDGHDRSPEPAAPRTVPDGARHARLHAAHPSPGPGQALPRWSPGPAGDRPGNPPRRSVRHHRPQRRRKVLADPHPQSPGASQRGAGADRRRRHRRLRRPAPGRPAPTHRHDLPALQPDVGQDRVAEHRPAAAGGRGAPGTDRGAGRRAAATGRPGGKTRRLSGAALRRAETARRHRPRAGAPAADTALRRSHLGAGPGEHPGDPRAAARHRA